MVGAQAPASKARALAPAIAISFMGVFPLHGVIIQSAG